MGQLGAYSLTATGLVPAGDDREILALARQIAHHTLPHEAFYRAPGYPAVLALGLKLGVPDAGLLLFARGLNALCHLLTAVLVGRLARSLWASRAAGLTAAALVGFNPVLLHFAGDALDITLAITLMTAGIVSLIHAQHGHCSPGLASFWLSLAALCRPQLVPLLLLPPLLSLYLPCRRGQNLLRALAPAALIFVCFGLVNQQLADDFRLLPWQGAYNLWAANHPGANGRYFDQTLSVDSYDPAANTARLESEALYLQREPTAPQDYPSVTRYWQAQALASIRESPAAWLALMGQKLRYLLNNEEQYNNKTYAFYKARSRWLGPNPLCWALVLTCGVAGAAVGWKRREFRLLLLAIGLCAGGVLLYYVSDRFRAPLVPLLSVLAGGITQLRFSPDSGRAAGWALTALVLALLPVAYDPRETLIQDHMMVAASATALGRHAEALGELAAAAETNSQRPTFVALSCIVRFNAWLADAGPSKSAWIENCQQAAAGSASARLLSAHAAWLAGNVQAAVVGWREAAVPGGPDEATALAALSVARALTEAEQRRFIDLANQGSESVLAVLANAGDEERRQQLLMVQGPLRAESAMRAAKRLWGKPAP